MARVDTTLETCPCIHLLLWIVYTDQHTASTHLHENVPCQKQYFLTCYTADTEWTRIFFHLWSYSLMIFVCNYATHKNHLKIASYIPKNTIQSKSYFNLYSLSLNCAFFLSRSGWVMHICISKLIIIDSDNGSSSRQHQAIIWTNVGMLLIWSSITNFSVILTEIYIFSFKEMHLLLGKWWPFCLNLKMLIQTNIHQDRTMSG